MPAKRKILSHAAKVARENLAFNIRNAIARAYPRKADWAAWQKISQATGNSASTVQRISKGETGPSLDTIAELALHLGVPLHELLIPRKEALPTATEPSPPPAAGARPFRRKSGGA